MLRSCDIVTEDVLKAALRGQLSAERRAVVLRHLGESCEACLDLLERWTTEEMMTELHASDDLLSWAERERVFAAASAGFPAERPPLRVVHPELHRRSPLAWGAVAALAAVVLLTVAQLVRRNPSDVDPDRIARLMQPTEGLKGAQKPAVTLFPLVGSRTPTPHVIRALASGQPIARGEVLLLRIRLAAPAWVYLLSQKQDEPTELVWPLEAGTRHAAGEFELADSGAALAVDPEALGTGARLVVIASPERIDADRLRIQDPLHTRAEAERAFPGCGVDLLPVFLEPKR